MKKSKFLFSKLLIGASFGLSAIALPIVSVGLSNNQTVVTNSLNDSQVSLNVENRAEEKSYVKVKSMDDTELTVDERENIRRLYKNKPSSITSKETVYDADATPGEIVYSPASIFHLLEFDTTKVHGITTETISQNNAPRVTNLSNVKDGTTFTWNTGTTGNTNPWLGEPSEPDINLSPETPIPYLINNAGTNDAEKRVTQSQLDEAGILFLRVDMKDLTTNQPITEYITISGFGSQLTRKFLSSSIDLPGSEYKKTVNQVSTNDLINYPQFEPGLEPTNIALTSRTNNTNEGTLNYTLLFNYKLNKDIAIDGNNASSSTVLNRYTDAVKQEIDTQYHQEFVLKGFIKSPNISNQEIIIIIASIIGSGIAICIIVYLVSLITRKIRFAKKM